jgi:putative FmdB family regulatory protein
MPLYEYRCQKCNELIEAYQSIKDDNLKDCPICKSEDSLVKQVSIPGRPIFNGTGFYETDFKSK